MKATKSLILATGTVFTMCALAACNPMGVGYSQNESGRITPTESPVLQSESAIGDQRAREIALDHARLAANDVEISHEGRDTKYGRLMHEVEFYTADREFDYLIDAETGEVVAFDEEAEHFTRADWHRDIPPSTNSSAFIGEQDAKRVALSHAGLAEGDVENMRISLDFDDRMPRYEIEFDAPGKSFEYVVTALDGNIISFKTVQR